MFLAEAKGRYSPVSFGNKEFGKWRDQFKRVAFVDSSGVTHSIKGHIVATRFSTENNSGRVMSGIWAEDPESPGERPLNQNSSAELGRAIIAAHYSNIATKIGQPLLASALASGVALPEQLSILGIAWRVVAGPLEGRRFIGGYFSPDGAPASARDSKGRIVFEKPDPLRLDRSSATFVGLEESIFRQVVSLARSEAEAVPQLSRFEQTDFFYSGFSVLRDGSAIGPIEFFSPDENVTL
ncbi:hypothetical protein A1507_13190 [Methylomonas koyamae]|uniref:Uncharacterized protein n=1 Tax=Methylomonas koyamae TaxID=702114 RepID=A0A177NDU0_9GAMM|nr:hypothetical protein A1507_13190 [Methylomonas koyamae]